MKTAKRRLDIVIGMALCLFLSSAIAAPVDAKDVELERTINVLSGALQSLTESSKDPCPICARQTKKKAFEIINTELRAERVFSSGDLCRFIRTTEFSVNELSLTCYPPFSGRKKEPTQDQGTVEFPLLTFRFHTPEQYLIGIAEKDFTRTVLGDQYHSWPPGTIFDGKLELVRYEYGDGPTYNYYPKRNHLEVHCRLLDLKKTIFDQSLTWR
jgi:hypothetical protein